MSHVPIIYPPDWAVDRTLDALNHWDNEYGNPTPSISLGWIQTSRKPSSGLAIMPDSILIRAGSVLDDTNLVLLHEIAHVLRGRPSHDNAFWDVAWRLYVWANVPLHFALQHEYLYRRRSIQGYKRLHSLQITGPTCLVESIRHRFLPAVISGRIRPKHT